MLPTSLNKIKETLLNTFDGVWNIVMWAALRVKKIFAIEYIALFTALLITYFLVISPEKINDIKKYVYSDVVNHKLNKDEKVNNVSGEVKGLSTDINIAINSSKNSILSFFNNPSFLSTKNKLNDVLDNTGILGARDRVVNYIYAINIPAIFRQGVTINGTASTNVLTFQNEATMNGLAAIDVITKTTLQNTIAINGVIVGNDLTNVQFANNVNWDSFGPPTIKGVKLTATAAQLNNLGKNEAAITNLAGYETELTDLAKVSVELTDLANVSAELVDISGSSRAVGGILFGDGTKFVQDLNNLYWDNTNKYLGLGTSSPQELLDVNGKIGIADLGTTPVEGTARLYNVGGELYWNNHPISWGVSKWEKGSGSDIYRMDGNIGVGTSNPSQKLDVVGTILATSLTDGTATMTAGSINNLNDIHVGGTIYLSTNSIYDGFLTGDWNFSGGNISNLSSVGTTDLTASGIVKLTGVSSTDTGNNLLTLNTDGSVSYRTTDSRIFNTTLLSGTGAEYYLARYNGTTELTTSSIYDNGNVGIGTSAPTSRLFLAGGNFTQIAMGNPTLKGTYTKSGPQGVYISGKYAYVATDTSGLQIIDIGSPESPSLTGAYDTTGTSYGVYVSGKYAYVADSDAGLQIIDVSNPKSPTLTGTYNTTGNSYGLYVSGKYAYVADGTSGLQIIDVSNPASPSLAGTYNTTGDASGVYVLGKYAYVADYASGLQIIDISNSTSPSLVGTYDTTGGARGIYVSGDYAYVADYDSGLQIINVSNPASPSLVGTYGTTGTSYGVYVSGKYAYVADSDAGLQIIDVSNPASPSLVGTYSASSATSGVYVSGKYSYVTDTLIGLQIIDINGVETPAIYAGNMSTNDVTITENGDVGNNLYVRNALNIGQGGLFSQGDIATSGIIYASTGFISNIGSTNITSSGTVKFTGLTSTITSKSLLMLSADSSVSYRVADSRIFDTTLLSGTGVANYLTKYTGTTGVTTSLLYDNGTNVGLGTASPSGYFTVTKTNSAGVSDFIANLTDVTQSVSGNMTTYAYRAIARATHTSGTLASLQSNSTQAFFSGNGGTTTWGEVLTSNASVSTGATVSTLSMLRIYTPGNSGTISNLRGIWLANMTGGTNSYSIYSEGGNMYHSGNIGINTTNATEKLTVVGNALLTGTAMLANISTTSLVSQSISTTNITSVGVTATGSIVFSGVGSTSGGTNVVIIDASGKLSYRGIDSRTFDAALVDGSSPTANYITKWLDGDSLVNSIMYNSGTGVGVGTTNPLVNFQVSGGQVIYTNLGYTQLILEDTGSTGVGSGGSLLFKNYIGTYAGIKGGKESGITEANSSSYLAFFTRQNSTANIYEKMRISSGGNMGIGTSSPMNRLDVSGSMALGSYAGLYSAPTNGLIVSGNVGIGATDASEKLYVAGNLNSYGVITADVDLSGRSTNILTAYAGFNGFSNFSGGIGTGGLGKDSITNAQRITSDGNLVNIGSIQAGEMSLTKAGTFATKSDYVTGTTPENVAIGDVNGDGKADIATANFGSNNVSILINSGTGSYATKVDYGAGTNPSNVEIGDVNGDGKADLAVANYGSNSISVLMNNGDGTFATKVDYTVGTNPYGIALGDVSGDGKADITVANVFSNNVSVLINNGDGTFAAKVDYGAGTNTRGVAIGDVNGDGKADIATANNGTNNVSVLINNGNGTFATKVDYTVGTTPDRLAIGDVSGDGKADIATANWGSNNISVLINNGDSTFATKVDYTVGTNPEGVAIGDVNGDGKADITSANAGSNNVSVLINNGTGTFAAKVDYGTGTGPYGVAIGDVNSDGKADIMAANYNADTVSVLINQTTPMIYAQASTGNVGIGTTSPSALLDIVGNVGSTAGIIRILNSSTDTTSSGINIILATGSTATSNMFIRFGKGTGATQIGAIVTGTGASVLYQTTSDARLKDNIKDYAGALDIVKQLKPRTFEFKSDPGIEMVGFIAQELKPLYPYAVTGDENSDPNISPMGVDYGQLTPLLTQAIKELNNKLDVAMGSDFSTLYDKARAIYDNLVELKDSLGLSKGPEGQLVINSDLNATQLSSLNDVTISGDFSVGSVSIDSLSNSIQITGPACGSNTTLCDTQTLFLQKNKSGNVDILDGKVKILANGDAEFVGKVQAETLVASEYKVKSASKTAGTGKINSGNTEVTIETNAVKSNSKIFITSTTSELTKPLSIKTKNEGNSFTVSMPNSVDYDVKFDWFIVNIQE